jgi:hypothetical protein
MVLAADRPDPSKFSRARRVVREFTRWSAALGSAPARELIAELLADGTLVAEKPLRAAALSDLPPWLKE